MQSKILLPVLSIFLMCSYSATSQQSGEDLVKKMYKRFAHSWYRSLTFNQTTEFYRNDSLKGTQLWYEAIVFPDQFRIDFGAKDSGNAVIFKEDSSYVFKNGKLSGVRPNDNDLIFLLGGLYFHTLEQSIQKLKALGYNLEKMHADHWKGKSVWVIGDTGTGKNSNQLWIDQENLYLVRMLEFNQKRKEEGIFENHIYVGGGWTETKATFYFNDHLIQVETYHDCIANKPIDARIFDPTKFINAP